METAILLVVALNSMVSLIAVTMSLRAYWLAQAAAEAVSDLEDYDEWHRCTCAQRDADEAMGGK